MRKGARRESNGLRAVNGIRLPCVGAVVRDGAGRLLLIKRGHDPEAGKWSLPGGRIEPGETGAQALVREMREETRLTIIPWPLLGAVERPGSPGWAAGQLVREDWPAMPPSQDVSTREKH